MCVRLRMCRVKGDVQSPTASLLGWPVASTLLVLSFRRILHESTKHKALSGEYSPEEEPWNVDSTGWVIGFPSKAAPAGVGSHSETALLNPSHKPISARGKTHAKHHRWGIGSPTHVPQRPGMRDVMVVGLRALGLSPRSRLRGAVLHRKSLAIILPFPPVGEQVSGRS